MRNSIQISQVQKCQKGKKGSLPSRLVSVEPLEKATLNAMLFADLAPAKAAVCLHQTGQKGGLGPASQAACHEARRLGHRIQDPGQFASTEPYRLATGMAVCKNTRTRRLTRIPFGENQRNVWNLQPMCLKVSFWMGAAGPRHLADMGPHLCPQIGIERTGCKSFHGALALLRSSKTFLFLAVHCASSFPVLLPLSLGFTSTLGSRNHQLLCVTEGGPETQGREDSLKVTKTIRGRAGVQTETSFKCSQMHRY